MKKRKNKKKHKNIFLEIKNRLINLNTNWIILIIILTGIILYYFGVLGVLLSYALSFLVIWSLIGYILENWKDMTLLIVFLFLGLFVWANFDNGWYYLKELLDFSNSKRP